MSRPKAPNPNYDWPLMTLPRSISARRRYLGIVYAGYKEDCRKLDEIKKGHYCSKAEKLERVVASLTYAQGILGEHEGEWSNTSNLRSRLIRAQKLRDTIAKNSERIKRLSSSIKSIRGHEAVSRPSIREVFDGHHGRHESASVGLDEIINSSITAMFYKHRTAFSQTSSVLCLPALQAELSLRLRFGLHEDLETLRAVIYFAGIIPLVPEECRTYVQEGAEQLFLKFKSSIKTTVRRKWMLDKMLNKGLPSTVITMIFLF
jgi:hypothetical protein